MTFLTNLNMPVGSELDWSFVHCLRFRKVAYRYPELPHLLHRQQLLQSAQLSVLEHTDFLEEKCLLSQSAHIILDDNTKKGKME